MFSIFNISIKNLIVYLLFLTTIEAHQYTNALINQDSPYLQQHAHNPVNWMPWGKKAFKKAKKEDKFIFLSIGYSTCHWCHVMEKESFEKVKSANILNKNYVAIKVDREEMPNIDKYYQNVYSLLNSRSGGWPLTIIMTPDKKVIFAGTYIPAHTLGNRRDLNDLLTFIAKEYKINKNKINQRADRITLAIKQYNKQNNKKSDISLKIIDKFITEVHHNYDEKYKGLGNALKFPQATTFDTLLDIYRITKNRLALRMSQETLTAMANGGIYDQIEGGFFRYSTDRYWIIPHFEKMLYTNAGLIELYAKMYSIQPKKLYKRVVVQSIKNMNDRFLYDGLYKGASDADSEGKEGKYFLLSYDKSKKALQDNGLKNTAEILRYFNIRKKGNFKENMTNPFVTQKKIPQNIEKAKKILKKVRSEVSYPFIDSKMLTSWNALMASALFEARSVDEKYPKEGVMVVDNILNKLERNGILYHELLPHSTLKVKAYLEDYSFLISALISANQYTQNNKYLKKADKLLYIALDKFYKNGTWYLSDDSFKSKATLEDGSYKSAMATMIENIYIISLLEGDSKLYKIGVENLQNISLQLKQYPSSFAEAMKVVMMDKKALIVIKGSKNRIKELKKIKKDIEYPFLYILQRNINRLEACSDKECFSYSKNYKTLEDNIRRYIKF